MNKVYQMSELEHNAFIKHCKSSEIYRVGYIKKGYLYEEPQGEMAMEDYDRFIGHCCDMENLFTKNGKSYIVYETKEVKVKGYNNGRGKRWVK